MSLFTNMSQRSLWSVIYDHDISKDVKLALIVDFACLGADVHEKDSEGNTVLMWASERGCKEVVDTLLEKGADVNAKNKIGRTALMEASENGHKEVVELLIKNGANLDARGMSDETALIKASRNGHKEVVEVLIKSGADVNAKDDFGETAMMLAWDYEMRKVIMDAVKKRNKKTNGNVIVKGMER